MTAGWCGRAPRCSWHSRKVTAPPVTAPPSAATRRCCGPTGDRRGHDGADPTHRAAPLPVGVRRIVVDGRRYRVAAVVPAGVRGAVDATGGVHPVESGGVVADGAGRWGVAGPARCALPGQRT